MTCRDRTRNLMSTMAGIAVLVTAILLAVTLCMGAPSNPSQATSIFKPESTPADSIYRLSLLVLAITGLIFVIVFGLIAYAITKFRRRPRRWP